MNFWTTERLLNATEELFHGVAKLSVYPFEDCFRQSLKIFPILSYPVPLWSSNSFTVFFNPTELIF